MRLVSSATFLLFVSITSQVWAQNFQYGCSLFVVTNGNTAKVEIIFDGTGTTTAGLHLGDYNFTVSKRNDVLNVDSMEIMISSIYGGTTGTIVPMGTPWALAILNPTSAQTDIVQAHCKLKP